MLYTRTRSADDKYSHSVEIRTVSEDTSKPERKLRVYMVAPTPRYTNNQIVVEIPNVKRPIPLFILMRALGVISDYDIIETCLLNMAENRDLIEFFVPACTMQIKYLPREPPLNTLEYLSREKV